MKFYLKRHWGGEKPALGFGLDRISTLVSMATDNSCRVTINGDIHKSLDDFGIWPDPTSG